MALKKDLTKFWDWVWNSDSPWSYLVLILLIVIIIKFIIFPFLSLIFHTSLPLAIVESSSMEHGIAKDDFGRLNLCGEVYTNKEKIDFDEYWIKCGGWYEQNTNITKEEMDNFKFSNGFRKGDLMIISGWGDLEMGDIAIFQSNRIYPLIHRVISLEPLSTKGDHNSAQLPDEISINEDQVIGKAIARIPYLGWPKVVFCEKFNLPGICR